MARDLFADTDESTATPSNPEAQGADLFADEPRDQIPTEELSFSKGLGVDQGVGQFFKGLATDSYNVRAGGLLFEKLTEISSPEGAALVESNRNAKLYEKWQPKIWDAQDRLNAIKNTKSPEYQAAWEELQVLRENFRDDLDGKYTEDKPEQSFAMGELVETIKDNPGYVAGSMLKSIMADPALMLVPGGWQKAGAATVKATKNAHRMVQISSKVLAEAGGAAAVGIPLGVSAEIIHHYEENPNAPIDMERVKNTAITVGLISAAMPTAATLGKGAYKAIVKPPMRKVGEIMDMDAIKKVQREAQDIYIGAMTPEGTPKINKEAAINRAIAGRGESAFKRTVAEEALPDIDIFMSDAAIANRQSTLANLGPIGQGWKATTQAANAVGEGFNYLTQPIISRIRAMGLPHVARALDEHDMNLGTAIQYKQEIAERFSKAFGALDENQRAVAAIHMNNGSFRGDILEQFDSELVDSFAAVRKMLDDEYDEMISVGMKVGKTPDYFPREMDYIRFIEDQGVDSANILSDLAKVVNKKLNLAGSGKLSPKDMTQDMIRKHLSEAEVAKVINQRASKFEAVPSVHSSTSNMKSRTILTIEPDQMQYYADPRAALHNHINRVTPKIHDRAFFGGKAIDADIDDMPGIPDDEALMQAYINDHVARLANNGEMLPSEMDELANLLQARFIGSKRRARPWINNTKNILYAMTLGNPMAAFTQAGDLGAAHYLNVTRGIDDLIGNFVSTVRPDKAGVRFKMKDFGLDHIPELESMGAVRTVLEKSLKYGGFHAMDRLGKETILNSTYKKLRDVMTDPNMARGKKFAYFKQRYGQRLGDDEVIKIMDGIASGDPTNHHARLAMYSDLTRVQPVSMSQLPAAYLNHPNARIFFMLKTFTLKQIDLARNEVINEIRAGVKANDPRRVGAASLQLAKLAGTIGLANMSVDYVKRWMTGKEADLPDVMVDTALRNYGLSTYTIDGIMKGEIAGSVSKIIAPPFSVIENPMKEAFGVDTKGRWIDSIPVFGRTARTAKETYEEHF